MGSKQSVVEGRNSDYQTIGIDKLFVERLNENSSQRTALYYHDETDGVRETSFSDLNKKANRLAACILDILRDTDANRNQDDDYVIAVCMNSSDNVIVTLLAIWKTGAAYLPLEPNFPLNRTQHIVGEVKPALVICDHNVDRSVFQSTNCISFKELLDKSSSCSDDNIHTQNSVSRGEDDIAIVLYTSGSTGMPKGVRIPHSAVLNKLLWLQYTFPYSPSEIGALNTALISVDSVAEVWGPLVNGVGLLIIPPEVTRDPSKLVDLLESYKIERLVLVPTLLKSILAYLSLRNERLLSNLKAWICSGETLTKSLAETFFKYFFDGTYQLCNFYGTTEVMGDVTYYVCENVEELDGLANVPIGYPLDNTVIFILNDDLNPVKPGEIGEIFVAGSNLAKGYVAGREKSKFIHNRFTDNPKFDRLYRTGDFGKLIKEGCIQYEGRADSQVKVRGHRVELLEIERNLRSVEEVEKGVVLCYHSGKEDQAILAFVVPQKNVSGLPSQQANDIENILSTKLRDIEIPHVFVVESIPLLPNGKIDRQKLLNFYENRNQKCEISYDLTGISDDQLDIAKEVFQIVGNVLGNSTRMKISASHSFYELGGDSLNSVLTVTQLRNEGYFIGVTDFITAKCLGDVLSKICEKGHVEEKLTKFKSTPLTTHHKHQVISMVTTTFYEKSDLGQFLMKDSHYNDYKEFIEKIWDYLLEKDLSFVVTDLVGNIVGISLNVDGQDPPKITIKNSVEILLDFLFSIEKPALEKMLPQGKHKVFHALLMATSAKLTPPENIEAIQKMEEVNLDIARRKGFVGIFATNTSPLTQQLASDIYGYRTLINCQINKYVHHDGSKPFGMAADSQRVLVHWKNITEFSG